MHSWRIRVNAGRLTVFELGVVVLKVSLGALTPGADRMCVVFIEYTGRGELEQVRPGFLCNEGHFINAS